MYQTVIVIVLVVIAVLLLVRQLRRLATGKGGCECCSKSCPTDPDDDNTCPADEPTNRSDSTQQD